MVSIGKGRWCNIRWVLTGMCCLILTIVMAWAPAHAATAQSSDESLLEKLHEKKILSDEEYQELKQQETRGSTLSAEKSEQAKQRDTKIDKVLKNLEGIEIGTLTYFDLSGGEQKDGESYNRFQITRGYINIKKQLTPWLGFRVTPDVTQDESGDLKLRLKYLYGEFRPPNLGFFTDMKSEVGLGHMPWLDLEEHINPYRVQGTMFIERAGIFNSSDTGVSIGGNFGGQVGEDYQKKVSHYYPGRWGSWHVGVYNGGGYHASEANNNKVPEYRVSVRPLPDLIPGLQVHYFGLYGDGNVKAATNDPEYQVNLGMLSYQNEWITLTGQYAGARGNNKGSLVVPGTNEALNAEGYSFFFNTKLPVPDERLNRKLNLFARYDHLDPDTKNRVTSGDDSYNLVNGGLAWEFYKKWMVLLAYERVFYGNNNGGIGKAPALNTALADDWRVQTALQMEF
jgi:hypothetical protein